MLKLSFRFSGFFSASFLIFNRAIGSGLVIPSLFAIKIVLIVSRIYATPGHVLRLSGSVGVSLIMWLLGALIAACGTAVYIELGTGLPKSGGEKNYLEYIYTRPKFLVSCVYIGYTLIMVSPIAQYECFSIIMV